MLFSLFKSISYSNFNATANIIKEPFAASLVGLAKPESVFL